MPKEDQRPGLERISDKILFKITSLICHDLNTPQMSRCPTSMAIHTARIKSKFHYHENRIIFRIFASFSYQQVIKIKHKTLNTSFHLDKAQFTISNFCLFVCDTIRFLLTMKRMVVLLS